MQGAASEEKEQQGNRKRNRSDFPHLSPLPAEAVVPARGTPADCRPTAGLTGPHRGLEHQEVGLRDLESVEVCLQSVRGPRQSQGGEDVGVHGAAVGVNQLHEPVTVRVSGDHIRGEYVLQQVLPLLGLQLEVERVPDSDGGGGSALVLDQEADPAVQSVLRREVGDGDGLAGPGAGSHSVESLTARKDHTETEKSN